MARPARVWNVVAAAVALVALVTFPFGQLTNKLLPIPVTRWAEGEPERRVVAVHEGRTETVVFFRRMLLGKPVSDVMLTNSFSMSTTGYGVRRYRLAHYAIIPPPSWPRPGWRVAPQRGM